MEVIKYNKDEINSKFTETQRLVDIIRTLEAEAENENSVICKITVNGLPFSEEDESRFSNTGIHEIKEIEIQKEKLESVVKHTVASLIDFITKMTIATVDAADALREGKTATSQKLFSDAISKAQWLAAALIALKPNLLKISGDSQLDSMWAPAEEHMIATVRELMVAYERQDFVLVSDVLEYELYNSLEKWVDILSRKS
jgi:hypothetical protein